MATAAVTRDLPGELPVMPALALSNMRNLPADNGSVGFFQMRVGVWEKSYPGYERQPVVQLRWFLDRAASLAGEGKRAPAEYGAWIADVERPEGQFRARFQLRLAEARALIRAGCAPARR
jgi:hypothetical protein